MGKLFAVIHKELLLLWRDKAGLLVLFVMPAVLVCIITLVQENVLKIMGESNTHILFIDEDRQELSAEIKTQLGKLGKVRLVTRVDEQELTHSSALDFIRSGEYQFGVFIPAGLNQSLADNAAQVIEKILNPNLPDQDDSEAVHGVVLYFDPAVRGGFRTAVITNLEQILFALQMKERLSLLSERLPLHLQEALSSSFDMPTDMATGLPKPNLLEVAKPFFQVEEKSAARNAYEKLPSSVQQNVPAWTLFGMFFIVVPMAGTLLKERREGTLIRLRTMPLPLLTLVFGKILAFQLICFGQFFLIAAIGRYLLPALGTPVFELGDNMTAVFLLVFTSSLAATGYGVCLGALARTFEQISMFGPISIVVAAAIGGVMVPVFAMPEFMSQLSVISPLNWGLEGFMDIFVRGGGIMDILPEILCFILFFALTVCMALISLYRKSFA